MDNHNCTVYTYPGYVSADIRVSVFRDGEYRFIHHMEVFSPSREETLGRLRWRLERGMRGWHDLAGHFWQMQVSGLPEGLNGIEPIADE